MTVKWTVHLKSSGSRPVDNIETVLIGFGLCRTIFHNFCIFLNISQYS